MEIQKLVVVTGGAGFVGSHLCERLVKEGYKVISLDNYFTGTPENHVEGVAYRTGHTKDIDAHIPETPDLVFHLGEYARTEKSFEDVELVWDLKCVDGYLLQYLLLHLQLQYQWFYNHQIFLTQRGHLFSSMKDITWWLQRCCYSNLLNADR